MLIKLDDTSMISLSEIKRVYRVGNYTEVYFGEREYTQVWDPEYVLWKRLEQYSDKVTVNDFRLTSISEEAAKGLRHVISQAMYENLGDNNS